MVKEYKMKKSIFGEIFGLLVLVGIVFGLYQLGYLDSFLNKLDDINISPTIGEKYVEKITKMEKIEKETNTQIPIVQKLDGSEVKFVYGKPFIVVSGTEFQKISTNGETEEELQEKIQDLGLEIQENPEKVKEYKDMMLKLIKIKILNSEINLENVEKIMINSFDRINNVQVEKNVLIKTKDGKYYYYSIDRDKLIRLSRIKDDLWGERTDYETSYGVVCMIKEKKYDCSDDSIVWGGNGYYHVIYTEVFFPKIEGNTILVNLPKTIMIKNQVKVIGNTEIKKDGILIDSTEKVGGKYLELEELSIPSDVVDVYVDFVYDQNGKTIQPKGYYAIFKKDYQTNVFLKKEGTKEVDDTEKIEEEKNTLLNVVLSFLFPQWSILQIFNDINNNENVKNINENVEITFKKGDIVYFRDLTNFINVNMLPKKLNNIKGYGKKIYIGYNSFDYYISQQNQEGLSCQKDNVQKVYYCQFVEE